jgi:hypothetical protein
LARPGLDRFAALAMTIGWLWNDARISPVDRSPIRRRRNMADAAHQKKGLTKFGWLLVGGAAAFLLSNKDRRDKALSFVRDLAAKVGPSSDAGSSPASA